MVSVAKHGRLTKRASAALDIDELVTEFESTSLPTMSIGNF